MVFNSDYKVIKLDNGDTIIAEVDHKDWELNNYVKVKNAMQIVNFNTTPSESPFVTATIFLARWNPYTEDDVITVPLNKIITINNASMRLIEYYSNAVDEFNNNPQGDIGSPDDDEWEKIMEQYKEEELEDNPLEALKIAFNEMVKKTKRNLH